MLGMHPRGTQEARESWRILHQYFFAQELLMDQLTYYKIGVLHHTTPYYTNIGAYYTILHHYSFFSHTTPYYTNTYGSVRGSLIGEKNHK